MQQRNLSWKCQWTNIKGRKGDPRRKKWWKEGVSQETMTTVGGGTRKEGRKYLSKQVPRVTRLERPWILLRPVECQLTGPKSHWLPVDCSRPRHSRESSFILECAREDPLQSCEAADIEASLGVVRMKEEPGLDAKLRKADPCSPVRVVLAGAEHSLQGRQSCFIPASV